MAAMSRVNLLPLVTVASARISSTATGLPTMLLAPTTTQCAPRSVTPLASTSSTTARAVHGTRLRRP